MPRGRRLGRLAVDTRGVLVAAVHPPARASFYARHGGWTLPLAWLAYLVGAALAIWPRGSWGAGARAAQSES